MSEPIAQWTLLNTRGSHLKDGFKNMLIGRNCRIRYRNTNEFLRYVPDFEMIGNDRI